MNMTAQEMRELDAWIAEHVMDVKWRTCLMYPDMVKFLSIDDRYPQAKGPEILANHLNNIPSYTTDPAAAMEVLKKCCELTAVVVQACADGSWAVSQINGKRITEIGPTLEVSFCLFAKKLFTK